MARGLCFFYFSCDKCFARKATFRFEYIKVTLEEFVNLNSDICINVIGFLEFISNVTLLVAY